MSSVVVRRVASTPSRTAAETWRRIIELVAPQTESAARAELESAAGVACSSISSEATASDPIVVMGSGPRVRMYCIFGEDAVVGEDVNEDALAQTATEGDWSMSIPCLPEDVNWSNQALAAASSRISARSTGEDVPERADGKGARAARIDTSEFTKP